MGGRETGVGRGRDGGGMSGGERDGEGEEVVVMEGE